MRKDGKMEKASAKDLLTRATGVVCRQGMVPFPLSDAAVGIIRIVAGSEQDELALICAFEAGASLTLDQLSAASGFDPDKAERLADALAKKGLVFNQPSSAGVKVFRLMPFMIVGLMEYLFMGELTGSDEEKELARLFEQMVGQLRAQTQENYEQMVPLFEKMKATDRTVPLQNTSSGKPVTLIPVDKGITVPDEVILPSQSVDEIIDKFDDIAVGYCFCRQRRKALGGSCSTDAPGLNCFTFGKSARYTSAQGFARKVSKTEARQIMAQAEDAGLVHKAFHPGSREERLETSICNCCKDCCDTMNLWRSGTTPLVNSTYHLAVVDTGGCTGCGTCEELCPTEAIRVTNNGTAEVDDMSCFGCGVCAWFCPETAISLKQGLRRVFILPPRLR
ncbi:MAG TPA: hypothetical protein DHV36_11565 [Desulfobacteraceae bacterium]|nr:hypothetical protein [Desulfobacteraceae bacterium]